MSKTVPDDYIRYVGATTAASEFAFTRLTALDYPAPLVIKSAPTIIALYWHKITLQVSQFVLLNPDMVVDSKLTVLAEQYRAGRIDLPEIALQMGAGWSVARVVAKLEEMGAYRPFTTLPLTNREIDEVLASLPNSQDEALDEKYDNPEWIEREVAASQRIEGIYVDPT